MYLLREYSEEPAAYIDLGLLKNYGIPAEVQNGAMSEIFPAPGAGTGSIALYVPDEYAEKAEKILSEHE